MKKNKHLGSTFDYGTQMRELLVEELAQVISHGKEMNSYNVAENIVHILEKCWGIDVEEPERNEKKWIG